VTFRSALPWAVALAAHVAGLAMLPVTAPLTPPGIETVATETEIDVDTPATPSVDAPPWPRVSRERPWTCASRP